MRVAAALILAVAVTACDTSAARRDEPAKGGALKTSVANITSGSKLAPGQEAINMVTAFINQSDDTVTLREIRPVETRGLGETGALVRILIGDASFVGGWYLTMPPVVHEGGKCQVQQLDQVEGLEIGPGAEKHIAVWVRALKPGEFRVERLEIIYQQDEQLYSEIDTYSIVGTVIEDRQAVLPPDIRRCAQLARVLPGNG